MNVTKKSSTNDVLLIDFINSLKESLISDLEKNENSLNTKEFFMEMINIYLNHLEEKKNI